MKWKQFDGIIKRRGLYRSNSTLRCVILGWVGGEGVWKRGRGDGSGFVREIITVSVKLIAGLISIISAIYHLSYPYPSHLLFSFVGHANFRANKNLPKCTKTSEKAKLFVFGYVAKLRLG